MSAGLALTQQPPVSPLVELRADDTAHRMWGAMAETEDFQRELVAATGALVGDLDHRAQRERALAQLGVTALDGVYAGILPSLDTLDPQFGEVMDVTAGFGAPEPTAIGLRAPLSELADGPLAVLDAAGRTPTVAIHLDDAFGELRADQRRDVVALLADLAAVCDVRVVCGRATAAGFRRRFHEHLPVSAPCNADHPDGEVAARVERARAALDADGRETNILRTLAREASETASYHTLYAESNAGESRVRQCLGRLADLDLVATFDGASGRMVEVLAAGRQFLETLDSEIGRQQSILDAVSETGNRCDDSRVTPHAHEGRPDAEGEGGAACGGDGRTSRFHQVRSMSRWRYAAVAGCAIEGGVSVVDHPIGAKEGWGDPHWYYDSDDDRLVVGGQYDNPMQGWVCIALALADERTFRHVLTEDRFESGKLGDMLADHTDLLRNSRCLGYLKDADATPEDYRDALLAAAEDLRELTRDFAHENYDDRGRFRGTILREAHGLAGTMAHLIDLADVDLVREFRIPRFSRDFKPSQKQDLAETIAIGATIQSRYGHFAAYRQLFEAREEKRETTFPPTVDAGDPFGECIGSFVLAGPGLESFADRLRRRLGNQKTHDDAPEFAVRVPVELADDRRHTARTAAQMCRQKSIRPTREATSLLAGLTGTPYDAARALHNLALETKAPNRAIRLDEVRFALSTLDAGRIMPAMNKPTLSSIVHALLAADGPLAQSTLADRAGVSARSIRNHTETLAAFDFIREADAGWRFSLPFRDDERGADVRPWFVATDSDETPFVRDVLADAIEKLLPAERFADPDDPVGGALFAGPGESIPELRETAEWLTPWIRTVQTLLDDGDNSPSPRTAVVGEPPTQTSLTATPSTGMAD